MASLDAKDAGKKVLSFPVSSKRKVREKVPGSGCLESQSTMTTMMSTMIICSRKRRGKEERGEERRERGGEGSGGEGRGEDGEREGRGRGE